MDLLGFILGTAKNDQREIEKISEGLGDIYSSDAETIIDRVIHYELEIPEGYELRDDQVLSELECEEIDIVEIIMSIEDLFDKHFTYPDWKDRQLNALTVNDLVKPLEEYLKENPQAPEA